jgi:hypothetical protein
VSSGKDSPEVYSVKLDKEELSQVSAKTILNKPSIGLGMGFAKCAPRKSFFGVSTFIVSPQHSANNPSLAVVVFPCFVEKDFQK